LPVLSVARQERSREITHVDLSRAGPRRPLVSTAGFASSDTWPPEARLRPTSRFTSVPDKRDSRYPTSDGHTQIRRISGSFGAGTDLAWRHRAGLAGRVVGPSSVVRFPASTREPVLGLPAVVLDRQLAELRSALLDSDSVHTRQPPDHIRGYYAPLRVSERILVFQCSSPGLRPEYAEGARGLGHLSPRASWSRLRSAPASA